MHDVATHVLIWAMAVPLLQIQSQPDCCVHEAPSHEPMQSFHEQDGSQPPIARDVPARAAMVSVFILVNGLN